jgi:phytoene/squalene synthetase
MTIGSTMPFALRRPVLLARDLVVRRSRPDIAKLESVRSAEAFVWTILPHAARTFSACIALLPAPLARAAAVAYLYCRTLDTYEDLVPTASDREASLRAFAARFAPGGAGVSGEAPPIDPGFALDARDRTHVVLVNRCALVDEMFRRLEPEARGIIVDLVRGMSEGMIWSSATFERQGGVLENDEQLSRYCRYVLGLPTLFAVRLLRLHHGGSASIPDALHEDTMLAGEFIQLANVTRDIEKDLARGIAYHPALRDLRGRSDLEGIEERERVRGVREALLLRALSLAPAYTRMAESIDFPGVSFGRGSTLLMLLFTDRYYRTCARRVGREPWPGPRWGASVLLRALPAIGSRRAARRILHASERRFREFVERTHPS